MKSNAIYTERRQALAAQLADNSVVWVASGAEKIRNRDVEYAFRPASDFYYLTGFSEPDAVLMLKKQLGKLITGLFLRPKDSEKEVWQGRRLGVEFAPQQLNIDQAWEISELVDTGFSLLTDVKTVYVSFSELPDWMETLSEWVVLHKANSRKGDESIQAIADLDPVLHEMRLIKSEAEIAILRQAARVSVQGHLSAMKSVASEKFEYQVQADMENTFKQRGAPRVAFNTIVAGGDNACVLHYTENTAKIHNGDLVLVDAGAEFGGYAGDITSTFPANGQFTRYQAALYELVLATQKAVIQQIQPGILFEELQKIAVENLTQGLIDLGILSGKRSVLIEDEAYKPFYMHGVSHWLGMDVHDVGAYKKAGQSRPLQAGMVLTVEPGLYLPKSASEVAEVYRGIGIRIEEDVLVTDSGCEVLTAGLPRTVAEIERWMMANRH